MTDEREDEEVKRDPVWIRARSVSDLFGLRRTSVNCMVASGRVRARRIGGCVLYNFADIAATIEAGEAYR